MMQQRDASKFYSQLQSIRAKLHKIVSKSDWLHVKERMKQ